MARWKLKMKPFYESLPAANRKGLRRQGAAHEEQIIWKHQFSAAFISTCFKSRYQLLQLCALSFQHGHGEKGRIERCRKILQGLSFLLTVIWQEGRLPMLLTLGILQSVLNSERKKQMQANFETNESPLQLTSAKL